MEQGTGASDDGGGGMLAGAFAGLLVAVMLLLPLTGATASYVNDLARRERSEALVEAMHHRANLESALNRRVFLERGLAAFLESWPGATDEELERYLSRLVLDDLAVRNLAVLEGYTVRFVHPREGNEAVLGKDLSTVPEQADMLRRVAESGKTVLAGPYELVQGGIGVVARMPVYRYASDGSRTYRGQAAVVVMLDALLDEVGFGVSRTTDFALRGTDGSGAGTKAFWGDDALFSGDPVLAEVSVPGGWWSLAAVRKGGWSDYVSLKLLLHALSVGFSAFFGSLTGMLVSTRRKMRRLAFHDSLTGLPNRPLFMDRFFVALSQASRSGSRVYAFMIDLDRFKEVNDSHGHSTGDAVLVEAARRLRASLRRGDTVARIGGDEFAAIVADNGQGRAAVEARLRSELDRPYEIGGAIVRCGASAGCAAYPDDGDSREFLLAKADERMYAEKIRRGGR